MLYCNSVQKQLILYDLWSLEEPVSTAEAPQQLRLFSHLAETDLVTSRTTGSHTLQPAVLKHNLSGHVATLMTAGSVS